MADNAHELPAFYTEIDALQRDGVFIFIGPGVFIEQVFNLDNFFHELLFLFNAGHALCSHLIFNGILKFRTKSSKGIKPCARLNPIFVYTNSITAISAPSPLRGPTR